MRELKILQTIQKLTIGLKKCKYCIAGFALFMLVVLPHNIQSSCDYTLDMNGHSLTTVGNITWVNNQKQYYGTVTIAGIKYVSTKVGQGFQGNSYEVCTSSNGNAYYLATGAQRLSACPDGSSLITIGSATGTPTPKQVFDTLGIGIGGAPNCISNVIYIAATDSGMRFFNTVDHNGNNPVASNTWSYISSGYGSYTTMPLCKLDYQ